MTAADVEAAVRQFTLDASTKRDCAWAVSAATNSPSPAITPRMSLFMIGLPCAHYAKPLNRERLVSCPSFSDLVNLENSCS